MILLHWGLTARKWPGVALSPDQPTRYRRKQDNEPIWCIGNGPNICISFNPHSPDEDAYVQLYIEIKWKVNQMQTVLLSPLLAPKQALHPAWPDTGSSLLSVRGAADVRP